MKTSLPIFKIIPIESEYTEIAIVDEPAIEEYFLAFSNQISLEFNTDKMTITGPVMIPDKLIYRNDYLGERFVVYDAEGIKIAAELFFKNGNRFNTDHSEAAGIQIIESWFDKTGDIYPKGTWMITAKVKDPKVWSLIKEGEWQGFSFQAIFQNELIGEKSLKFNKTNMNELKVKLKQAIDKILFAEEPMEVPVIDPVEVEETVVVITEDKVNEIVTEAVKVLTETINEVINGIETRLAALESQTAEATEKIEEFGKQEINLNPKKEEVQGEAKSSNPALKYF